MSQTEQPQDHYAETAFRADAIPRQAPLPEKSVWGKLGSNFDIALLPWGNYVGINPTDFEYEHAVGWLQSYHYLGDEYRQYNMINEERWSQYVEENVGGLYRICRFLLFLYSHGFSFILPGGKRAGEGNIYGDSGIRNPSIYLFSGYVATGVYTPRYRISHLWVCYSYSLCLGQIRT